MSDAPEKIWITPEPCEGHEIWDASLVFDTKNAEGYLYHHDDTVTALQATIAKLTEALETIAKSTPHEMGETPREHHNHKVAVDALATKGETDVT